MRGKEGARPMCRSAGIEKASKGVLPPLEAVWEKCKGPNQHDRLLDGRVMLLVCPG